MKPLIFGFAVVCASVDIPVTHNTPPTFLLKAEVDHVDNVNGSLAY